MRAKTLKKNEKGKELFFGYCSGNPIMYLRSQMAVICLLVACLHDRMPNFNTEEFGENKSPRLFLAKWRPK
jgi:hypothetical protein